MYASRDPQSSHSLSFLSLYFSKLHFLIIMRPFCHHRVILAMNRRTLFFFFIYMGCPGQLTRTTTIPHGSLDILQAQEQVRHRGGDRRTHRGSNPGRGRNKSHELTTAVKPSRVHTRARTRALRQGKACQGH